MLVFLQNPRFADNFTELCFTAPYNLYIAIWLSYLQKSILSKITGTAFIKYSKILLALWFICILHRGDLYKWSLTELFQWEITLSSHLYGGFIYSPCLGLYSCPKAFLQGLHVSCCLSLLCSGVPPWRILGILDYTNEIYLPEHQVGCLRIKTVGIGVITHASGRLSLTQPGPAPCVPDALQGTTCMPQIRVHKLLRFWSDSEVRNNFQQQNSI